MAGTVNVRKIARPRLQIGRRQAAIALCGYCSLAIPTFSSAQSMSGPAATQRADGPPDVSIEDIVLLAKTARRSMCDSLRDRPARAPYRPPSLNGIKAILSATLRQNGGVIATAQTDEIELDTGA